MKVLLVGLIAAATAGAQWLNYPTPGVPKNLAAPAPKTADGRPDLSGIWQGEQNRQCPPIGCNDMQISQEFMNIGWSLKDGLPLQPWAAAALKKRIAENGKDDPYSRCLPGGVLRSYTTPLFRKIIQTPGLVIILSERDVAYRQIFTDGRPLPADPQPSWNGYSSGKWDGETLVVETIGFRDGMWLDRNGSPMTDAAKITERFRRVNYGNLEIEVTVDDPKAYTKPWTVKLHQLLVPNTELLDYVCLENEKDVAHYVGK